MRITEAYVNLLLERLLSEIPLGTIKSGLVERLEKGKGKIKEMLTPGEKMLKQWAGHPEFNTSHQIGAHMKAHGITSNRAREIMSKEHHRLIPT